MTDATSLTYRACSAKFIHEIKCFDNVVLYGTYPPSFVQTMAVATLATCYNNKAVFSGVVKIRKGQAVDLMMHSNNMLNLRSVFYQYIGQVGACLQ